MSLDVLSRDYDGGSPDIPEATGDVYRAGDLMRDLHYVQDKTGRTLADLLVVAKPYISGGVVTKGAGDTLNITPAVGCVPFQVKVPDSYASNPPSVKTEDTYRRIASTQQTNMAIAGATLDGSTINYVKLAYAETNGPTRARLKGSGTYVYVKVDGFVITVTSVAGTAYELVLATFTGTGGGAFTITDITPDFTDLARTLVDDATAAAAQTTLGLGFLLGNVDLTTATLDDLLLATSGPFEIKAWNKSLWARVGASVSTGTADTDTQNKLVLSTATFQTDGVVAGDVAYNSTDNVYAMVLKVESETSLLLDWDAFPDGNETFVVYDEPTLPAQFVELTGVLLDGDGVKTADTDTANHLLDADGTDWTTIISVGDWAMNLNTGKVGKVTAVAAHDLTLQWDAFPNGNEPYYIYAGTVTISDADSLINGYIMPEMNIGGRFLGGGLAAGGVEDDTFQSFITHINRGPTAGGGLGYVNPFASTSLRGDGTAFNFRGIINTDAVSGTPRTSDHTQPRTIWQAWIMRIK